MEVSGGNFIYERQVGKRNYVLLLKSLNSKSKASRIASKVEIVNSG